MMGKDAWVAGADRGETPGQTAASHPDLSSSSMVEFSEESRNPTCFRGLKPVHQAQRSGRESPRAVNRSEAVALAAFPVPSVGFPTFGSRFSSRITFAAAPVIGSSSHYVDDDFLLLTRIRRGVNTGHTRGVERPSIIEAGRNLIDNVLDFHEDFITNGNC
jgi:hypothetical protein